MPKYKFVYTVSNGIYQMDVFTGLYIIAKNKKEALNAAERVDMIVSSNYDFQVSFEFIPKPHIDAKCINLINHRNCKPNIIKYQIQTNFKSSKRLMGFPVFSEDDFKNVSQKEFMDVLYNDYFTYMYNNKKHFAFESICYGILKV